MGIQRMCACRVGLRGGEYGGCIKDGDNRVRVLERENNGVRVLGENNGGGV